MPMQDKECGGPAPEKTEKDKYGLNHHFISQLHRIAKVKEFDIYIISPKLQLRFKFSVA